MNVIGFDNEKYMREQSRNIRDRIAKFGGKLYLEFGGKLFDDYHASRVLPGFEPDSKVKMLLKMKDEAEIVIAISADDIERNKRRGDLGITYDEDTLRLIDAFRGIGLFVGSVVITHYRSQPAAELFQKRLETLGIKVYRHYIIPDYPSNVELIVSEDGFGKNDYIETERSLVVVTAPGPGSGKMATCLSQLYHEHLCGINAGYAKFETFPIWNIPLKHPINLAYEAATADLDDVNMIDPFHLEAYGETTVNYNRDVEIFPVLNAILTRIYGESAYKSPTGCQHGRLLHHKRRGLPQCLQAGDHPPLLLRGLRTASGSGHGRRGTQDRAYHELDRPFVSRPPRSRRRKRACGGNRRSGCQH